MPSRADDRSTGVKLRRIVALALLAVTVGCSSVRVGYNNADTLLVAALDNYLDLSGQQEQLVRERVRALLAWHRTTQLRGYAELIRNAEQRVEGRIAPEEVLAFNREMNRRLVAIGEQAAPDLAALALTLEPDQLDRFANKLADDDSRTRREVVQSRRSAEQRLRRSIERAEEWFGSVSPSQRALIEEALARRPDSEEWWAAEREHRRRDLLEVLQRIHRERPPADQASAWLRAYFTSLTEPAHPERRARMEEFRRGNAELIAALINTASDGQKAVLLRKLRGYADDIAALAAAQRS